MFLDQSSQITRLRVTGCVNDTPTLRINLSNWLNQVNWHPVGMPPSAILMIRRVIDPLPGKISFPLQGFRVNTDWEQAMRNTISDLYRHASRPKQGILPANCEAILFADEGEMLACLCLDVQQGSAQTHWWWQESLKTISANPKAGLQNILCQHARSVPAAFSLLSNWGKVLSVLHTLSDAAAVHLLNTIIRVNGINAFQPDQLLIDHSTKETGRKDMQVSEKITLDRISPPWESWHPPSSVPRTLVREKACLLGLCLGLFSHPHLVRKPNFLQTLQIWWNQEGDSFVQGVVEKEITWEHKIATGSPQPEQKLDPPDIPPLTPTPQRHQNEINLQASPSSQTFKDSHTAPTTRKNQQNTLSFPANDMENNKITLVPKQNAGIVEFLTLQTRIETRLGGILYLINLMKRLDLPDCFDEHWHLSSQIGRWGLVELLGRCLLKGCDEDLTSDPLWSILAELDGRPPGILPGLGFQGSEVYQLPHSWWHFASGNVQNLYWAVSKNKLRIWSERQFLVLECPIEIQEWASPKKVDKSRFINVH